MKRTSIERKTRIRRPGSLPRVTHLRGRSRKLQADMALYIPEMLEFLLVHAWCEFPGCDQPSTVLHHRKGRNGRRLRDQEFWSAACDPHNQYAEDQTGHSLEIGWLERINSRGETA